MFIICFGGIKFSIIFSRNYVLGFKSVWFFVLVLNDIYDGNAQIFFVLRVARLRVTDLGSFPFVTPA